MWEETEVNKSTEIIHIGLIIIPWFFPFHISVQPSGGGHEKGTHGGDALSSPL